MEKHTQREPSRYACGRTFSMASRGPTSFQKKQKEDKRREKQRDKLARRLEKKPEDGSEKSTGIEHIQLGPQAPLYDDDF